MATPQVAPDHIVYWPNEEAQLNFATQPQLVNFFLQNPPPSRHRVRVNGTTALIGDENSTLREYLLNITRSPFHEQYERNGLTSIIARLLPDLTLEEGRLLAANYADLLILFHQTDVLLGRYPPEAVREHTLNVFREEFARLGLLEPPQRPTRAVVTPTGSGGRFR